MIEPMTLEEFEKKIKENRISPVHVKYNIEPCNCGDMNCHGWRCVEAK